MANERKLAWIPWAAAVIVVGLGFGYWMTRQSSRESPVAANLPLGPQSETHSRGGGLAESAGEPEEGPTGERLRDFSTQPTAFFLPYDVPGDLGKHAVMTSWPSGENVVVISKSPLEACTGVTGEARGYQALVGPSKVTFVTLDTACSMAATPLLALRGVALGDVELPKTSDDVRDLPPVDTEELAAFLQSLPAATPTSGTDCSVLTPDARQEAMTGLKASKVHVYPGFPTTGVSSILQVGPEADARWKRALVKLASGRFVSLSDKARSTLDFAFLLKGVPHFALVETGWQCGWRSETLVRLVAEGVERVHEDYSLAN